MSLSFTHRADAAASHDRITDEVNRFGFSSPVPFLSPAERLAFEGHLARHRPAPHAWFKGCAVTDPAFHDIASRPEIIERLRPLLGDDIVLWGAVIVRRPPGGSHPWHTDMETADPGGRSASVWIGIRNASDISGLKFITGSHKFGRSVQEVTAGLKENRDSLTDERLLEIARTIDPTARIVQGGLRDGEMVLFNGRVWHFGYNDSSTAVRTALLLQYAAADTLVQMPAGPGYEWPWVFKKSPRVPTILVSGSAHHSVNRIVPAPMEPLEGIPMITTVANSVALPLTEDPVKRWRPYPQFNGPTAALQTMSCHISVLSPGHHPHPPHIHPEEELLLMLDGEVEIELADDPAGTGSKRTQLKPDMFAYYPATQHHTIHNTGSIPASYLMFKWRGGVAANDMPLATQIFSYESAVVPAEPKPVAQKLLFQQATHTLNKLHAHLTTLQPGAGYAAHADPYDVAIILLSGEIETIGKRLRPLGVIYYSAGELHGMRNIGTTPATYLVFEFHSPLTPAALKQHLKKPRKSRLRRLLRRIAKAAKKLGR